MNKPRRRINPFTGKPIKVFQPTPPSWELPRSLPLGEALHMQRKMRGMSLQDLGEKVGCGKSYLSQIENGSNAGTPSDELLTAIEKVLEMRPGDLTERSAWRSAPEPIKQHVARLAQRDRATQHLAQLLQTRGLDDLYRSGELGALVDQLAPDHAPGDKNAQAAKVGTSLDAAPVELPLEVPLINSVAAGYPRGFTDLGYPARVADSYVRSPDVRDPDAFACRVVGDSMEPEYHEGDVVIFSPARAVKEGADCFVRFERNDETTFKRVYFERDGDAQSPVVRLRLQPLNARHSARVVDREAVAGLYAAVSVTRVIN